MTNPPDLTTDRRLRVRRSAAPWLLGISARQLDYRIANGEIKTIRDGRAVFIAMSELRRYALTNHLPIRRKPRAASK
jgi:hypothetical protein